MIQSKAPKPRHQSNLELTNNQRQASVPLPPHKRSPSSPTNLVKKLQALPQSYELFPVFLASSKSFLVLSMKASNSRFWTLIGWSGVGLSFIGGGSRIGLLSASVLPQFRFQKSAPPSTDADKKERKRRTSSLQEGFVRFFRHV